MRTPDWIDWSRVRPGFVGICTVCGDSNVYMREDWARPQCRTCTATFVKDMDGTWQLVHRFGVSAANGLVDMWGLLK